MADGDRFELVERDKGDLVGDCGGLDDADEEEGGEAESEGVGVLRAEGGAEGCSGGQDRGRRG